ncbi:MFS general substrate transporter [Athelia psychrophila]|uniref:MFS general substrate transporter n=1 Tax=Athelia psychrophila TaxID=1759441 RepID=A0A166WCB1_9AGAM|nr:MFS general substrate transporter [Fibularhizoctonia sp. CBS 109695]
MPLHDEKTVINHGQDNDSIAARSPSPATLNENEQAEDESADSSKNEKTGDVVTSTDADNDTLIVDWEGPDDPENPKNWTKRRKWAAVFIVSSFTFISPVSSSMIAPASGLVAAEFDITSTVTIALTTSIFILAYAIGPLILGPLSEIYGRSRVIQLANLWYLAWNLACGFATSTAQLIAFRFLAGLGGSAPLSIGGAVLGDCFTPEQRGQAIAIYSLAPLLGPVVGPVCGAWIAQRSTWRWVFWSSSIVDGAIQAVGFFKLDESYAPLLLERKAERIRKAAASDTNEKGYAQYTHIRTRYQTDDRHWKRIFAKALVRPFAIFAREPIVQLLGIYMAFIYGLLYIFLTTIPSIFEGVYGQKPGIAGLHYLALGIGLTGASQVNAYTLDKVYAYFKRKNGGAGKPEYRLPSMLPGTVCLPAGLLLTGWAVEARVFWLVPDIGIALVGAGTILSFQSIQSYVIDAFTLHAASALAAVSCLRSFAGFGFPLFAPAMYARLGYGKGDTVLAVVAVVIGCPAPWLFWKYGERIRGASRGLCGGWENRCGLGLPLDLCNLDARLSSLVRGALSFRGRLPQEWELGTERVSNTSEKFRRGKAVKRSTNSSTHGSRGVRSPFKSLLCGG